MQPMDSLSVTTLPTAEILGGKNARAWVSMIYIKKDKWELKY